jgi:prepilin-type N-terminal cleavage/methylation domain-containing protein
MNRRRGHLHRWRGFTLVEVLTAVFLVALLLGLLLIPIGNSIGYFRTATARGDAQTVARNSLEAMAREISEAAYVWQDMNDNTMLAFAPAGLEPRGPLLARPPQSHL